MVMNCDIMYGVCINRETYEKCFGKLEDDQKAFFDVLAEKLTMTDEVVIKYVKGTYDNSCDHAGDPHVLIGIPLDWITVTDGNGFCPCHSPDAMDTGEFAKFIAVNKRLATLKRRVLVYVEHK